MVADTEKPHWYGSVAIQNPNYVAGSSSNHANNVYEQGPLTENECKDLCVNTPACQRIFWRTNDLPLSCWMFSSSGAYAPSVPSVGVAISHDKFCNQGCTMVADTEKPHWYGSVAIQNPNYVAGSSSNHANNVYEQGPLTENECKDLCVNTPACQRILWRTNDLPLSCWMFSSSGAHTPAVPSVGVAISHDKFCNPGRRNLSGRLLLEASIN